MKCEEFITVMRLVARKRFAGVRLEVAIKKLELSITEAEEPVKESVVNKDESLSVDFGADRRGSNASTSSRVSVDFEPILRNSAISMSPFGVISEANPFDFDVNRPEGNIPNISVKGKRNI